ncbi:MAG: hypothetical protein ACJAYS_000958 [Lentimonas sp.]|jgi:hypothetical protein
MCWIKDATKNELFNNSNQLTVASDFSRSGQPLILSYFYSRVCRSQVTGVFRHDANCVGLASTGLGCQAP